MSERKIIHIDMDCFYAAVEIRDNPRLKGKPVAVGGRPGGRGVLTTANYEARKFGVGSAMSISQALKLCPNLEIMPVHFSKYKNESAKIQKIFKSVTSKVQPLSLDEAYLDVTECPLFQGSATHIAKHIRDRIFEDTGLTASAGIAPNKFLAKVASDWKKPNGQFTVTPKMISDFIKLLPVKKIPGVGKVTSEKMQALNIKTCADLQQLSIEDLNYKFGTWGVQLFDICRGIDNRKVSPGGKRKSLSVENTYSQDLESAKQCLEKLPQLLEEFNRRLQKSGVDDKIKSIFVKIKFHDFQTTTLESSKAKEPSHKNFAPMIEEAFYRQAKPVRLIGIGVKLVSEKPRPKTMQLPLF